MVFRTLVLLIACGLLLAGTAGPALARKPIPTPPEERPLTSDEQAASDRKVAAAVAYARDLELAGPRVAPLACVQANAAAQCWMPPQAFLGVEARDQVRGHYCGPAVGQVIANYSWAVGAGRNVFLQAKLAEWMKTDINGGTDAFNLERGLETATAGAPRRPANWDWLVTNLVDRDADGTTGDELHAYIRSNVSGSKMPLALAVKPHQPNSQFRLPSWPRPVWSPGHWIAVYGWLGNWAGNDAARTYYTDSSQDEGGATGKFWAPTRIVALLIGEHTKRIVW